MRFGGCFGWVFIFFWCGITFTFDGVMGWYLFRQCWTLTYSESSGTITRSELVVEPGSEGGKSYRLIVGYTFPANGQIIAGDQYRYGSFSSNDKTWKRIRADLPVGKVVPVYYDSGDPAEAVLVRGPMGLDLFVFWFLTPFNVIGIGGLVFLLRGSRPPFAPDDPRVIAATETGWQFRPMGRDWWAVFGGTMLAVTFAGIFIIGFSLGFGPPLAPMAGAWIAALTFASWVARRVCRGVALEVDDLQKSLSLPRRNLIFPFADVEGFTVEVDEKVDSDGDRTERYHVAVRHGDRTERFCDWSNRETASAVANWLDAAVRIPFRPS